MLRFSARGLICLLYLLLPLSNRAVLFQPLSVQTLASQAELVLQGTVLSKTVQRDSTGRIYTSVELKVADVWKGAVGTSPFLIVHGGGVLGEHESAVSGQVHYEIGEEVVAFLVRNERGEGVTLGLRQGKFHVWQDPQTRTKFVASPFYGSSETAVGQLILNREQTGSIHPGHLSLSELKGLVLEAVR